MRGTERDMTKKKKKSRSKEKNSKKGSFRVRNIKKADRQ